MEDNQNNSNLINFNENEFKKIIENHTKKNNFPVLFNVNIGHADPIITVPLGVKVGRTPTPGLSLE